MNPQQIVDAAFARIAKADQESAAFGAAYLAGADKLLSHLNKVYGMKLENFYREHGYADTPGGSSGADSGGASGEQAGGAAGGAGGLPGAGSDAPQPSQA